jgi:hypothetical protein
MEQILKTVTCNSCKVTVVNEGSCTCGKVQLKGNQVVKGIIFEDYTDQTPLYLCE